MYPFIYDISEVIVSPLCHSFPLAYIFTMIPSKSSVTKKKGTPGTTKEMIKEETKAGIIFTFIQEDFEIESFICIDPIFARVEGYQTDASFLTAEMVDYMKSELTKKLPEDDHSTTIHPLSEENAHRFLYEYTSCMDTCVGGEKATAIYVAVVSF